MSTTNKALVDRFVAGLERRNPHEPEFLQAVREFATNVMPLVRDREDLQRAEVLERMTEPDRIVIFRVTWQDDDGRIRADRAWRVQFNNSLGPYKGGLRFGTETNLSRAEVPRLRADVQERAHRPAHGRRQGRLELQPQGQVRRRGHALLPVADDRAAPPHRRGRGHPGGRHRRGRARDRVAVRPVQADPQPLRRRAHRQGPDLRRQRRAHRGHRLRRRLLRPADARARRRRPAGQDLRGVGLGQRVDLLRREADRAAAPGWSRCRTRAARCTTPTGVDEEKLRVRQGAQARAPRAHQRVRRRVRLRVPRGRPPVGRGVRRWPSPARPRTSWTRTTPASW